MYDPGEKWDFCPPPRGKPWTAVYSPGRHFQRSCFSPRRRRAEGGGGGAYGVIVTRLIPKVYHLYGVILLRKIPKVL